MKSNYQSRYADLLTESADEALNKLIRDLDGAYTAPVRPADLSWEAAQRRLTLVKKTGSALPLEQPLQVHTTHRRKGPFFLAAAIVALAILSTTVLGAIGIIRFLPGQSTSTSLAMDAQLLQQLLQDKGTPSNIDQLAESGQFTTVDLTSHSYNLHIQKVYADSNNVMLLYTVDMNIWDHALSGGKGMTPVVTLTTIDGQVLPETAERANMGKQPVYKNPLVAILAYYDASIIPSSPAALELTATVSQSPSHTQEKVDKFTVPKVSQSPSPAQEEIGKFTVPVHGEKKMLTLHQTISSHGHFLTLERVVITPTEARFYYSYEGPLAKTADSDTIFADETVTIAGKTYGCNPFPSDDSMNVYGWFNQNSPHGDYTSIHMNLLDQKGSWTFTERAVVIENASSLPPVSQNIHFAWPFTFIVS